MSKWLLVSCLSIGMLMSGVGLSSAYADHGRGGYGGQPGHGHHPHCGYGGQAVQYGSVGLGYGVGYAPYGYSSYYARPGISVSRSSYYSGGLYAPPVVPVSPYGLSGYRNYGYRGSSVRTLPRVQLRIGF